MKLPQRFLPASAINKIIPVRNEVVDRASGVAERHAAIHPARSLRAQLLFRKILINLEPIVHALGDWTAGRSLARMLHKSGCLTHGAPPLVQAQAPAGRERTAAANAESPRLA